QTFNEAARRSTYLSGALSVFAGILLLAQPQLLLRGLALFVAASFLVDGLSRTVAALRTRAVSGSWKWTLVSGLINVVLALGLVLHLCHRVLRDSSGTHAGRMEPGRDDRSAGCLCGRRGHGAVDCVRHHSPVPAGLAQAHAPAGAPHLAARARRQRAGPPAEDMGQAMPALAYASVPLLVAHGPGAAFAAGCPQMGLSSRLTGDG